MDTLLIPTSSLFTAVPYEITIWTGSKAGAGTDANVFIQMYGKDGKTQEINLRNKTDNFEKGHVDKFKVRTYLDFRNTSYVCI